MSKEEPIKTTGEVIDTEKKDEAKKEVKKPERKGIDVVEVGATVVRGAGILGGIAYLAVSAVNVIRGFFGGNSDEDE